MLFICISLLISEVKHFFPISVAYLCVSFGKMPIQGFLAKFLIELFLFSRFFLLLLFWGIFVFWFFCY